MNTIFMCNNTTRMYKPTDKMGDLICENYALLQVMSRFGISLGFGDKSVAGSVRHESGGLQYIPDSGQFPGRGEQSYSRPFAGLSIPALVEYLLKAHSYFLDFQLPYPLETDRGNRLASENEVLFWKDEVFDAYVQVQSMEY